MSGAAQVTLFGNLTKDPILGEHGGQKVANFTIAVNLRKDEPAMFIRVAAWGKQAEAIGSYLTKGSSALVFGDLKAPRQWADKDNNVKIDIEVNASRVVFGGGGGGKSNPEQDPPAPKTKAKTKAKAKAADPEDGDADDDDLPF